ncbi:MAG: hypothetical protein FWD47_10460 [Treponema sp.]|nr:hypothetical protein [Treponema sp.]
MGIYKTEYKTTDGKTKKVKGSKPKDGAPDPKAGNEKNPPAGKAAN